MQCSPDYSTETFEDGSVVCEGNEYGDQCTFTCDNDYELNGQSVLTCISDGNNGGQWDHPAPTCDIKSKSTLTIPAFFRLAI